MRDKWVRSSFVFVVVAIGACQAPVAGERTSATRSAVQGGQVDTSHTFAVGISMADQSICSGTLIAPNLVLTARHCIAQDTGGDAVDCTAKFYKPMSAAQVQVTTDAAIDTGSRFFGVTSIEVPADASFCGNDIALLVLDAVVPDSIAKPATPVVEFSMSDHAKVGKTIATIGFGTTGPTQNDAGERRMRRDVALTCVPQDPELPCASGTSDSAREFVTQGWACEGDSGGGAYDQASLDAGSPLVLGVLSRGIDSRTACQDATYTRTDAFAQLLIDAAQKAADQGGYAYPAWTGLASPTPAPADDAGAQPAPGQAPAAATTPASNGGGSSGCAIARGTANDAPLSSILFVALGLAVARRRVNRC